MTNEIGSGRRGFIAGDIWSQIEFDLSEFRDLMHMRLESEEEAIGEKISQGEKTVWQDTAPRWEDPKIGVSVRPWLMIPYIKAIDQETLQLSLDAGKRLLVEIEPRIAARELSSELLHYWGLLTKWAGALQLVYFSKSDVGHQRSALAGGDARINDPRAHRRWFAHYFLKLYKRGNREKAEQAFEGLVNAIIDGPIEQPFGYDVKWFEAYLNLQNPNAPAYGKLRPAFKELSAKRMRDLLVVGTEGIPPIDLEFPDP